MIHPIFGFEDGVEFVIAPIWGYFKGILVFGVGFESRWVYELEKVEKVKEKEEEENKKKKKNEFLR